MTRSPLLNFIFGSILGGMIAIIVTLHIVTNQVQARNAVITQSIEELGQHDRKVIQTMQQIADSWQARAQKYEVKERYATVLYEYRPSAAFPVLHGVFGITLGTEANHPDSDVKAVWAIPVQTPVYSLLPGASYEWVDGKTGASIGRFPAVPPPDVIK